MSASKIYNDINLPNPNNQHQQEDQYQQQLPHPPQQQHHINYQPHPPQHPPPPVRLQHGRGLVVQELKPTPLRFKSIGMFL